MEAVAFERALRAFSQRKPFQPFVVEMVSGTRLQIDHPEALISRGPVAVHIDKNYEYTLFDHSRVSTMTSATEKPSATP